MESQNVLSVLEEKLISNIDYSFVSGLKLPYCNVYYLVCFVEVLHRFIAGEKYFSAINDAVENINLYAARLYNETDI